MEGMHLFRFGVLLTCFIFRNQYSQGFLDLLAFLMQLNTQNFPRVFTHVAT